VHCKFAILMAELRRIECKTKNQRITNSCLWHIYNIFITTLPILHPQYCFNATSILVHYFFGRCSLYARYMFGIRPNIYRTSTGHLPNMNWICFMATSMLNWGCTLILF